jgi:hypothetical protein
MFRLYVVASILWVGSFSYVIYDSSRSISSTANFIEMYDFDRRIGRPSAYDRSELVRWQNEQVARRTTAQRAILVFPLLAPVVYFIFSWIVRGFRHDNRSQENAPEPDKQKGRRFRPASTLLLILSILFFPVLWLVEPGAMTNFWVSRGRGSDPD